MPSSPTTSTTASGATTVRAECARYARERGENPDYPPCRTPWDDDHLVNLLIDESASVAMSQVMSKLFEQGRSFNLSVGLAAQFPTQLRDAGDDRTYSNLFNNISTLLFGKLKLQHDVAEVLSHENIDAEEFRHRIKTLHRVNGSGNSRVRNSARPGRNRSRSCRWSRLPAIPRVRTHSASKTAAGSKT